MDDFLFYMLIILFIIVIISVIVTIIYFMTRSTTITRSLTFEDINACVTQCDNQFEACQQACDNLGPDCGNGVRLACTITESVCNRDCYPSIYAIRNGSIYTLYFYDVDGNLLGNLSGWSPDKITVNASKFPILACVCNPNTSCDCSSNNNGILINGPGCYIVWYAEGFYTTSEVCHTG